MKYNLKRLLPALACCLAAVWALWMLFAFDNKYTARAPLTQDGTVFLDAAATERGALSVPVDGWDLWPDVLLSPAELADAPSDPVPTYIGQHLTLRPYHTDGSPYGAATWRLRLTSNGPVRVCLFLPEAYCASAVYVDGVFLGGTGSLSPYVPRVADGLYAFSVDGETQVLVQTANFTHYATGLVFPPVVGSPTVVGRYMALRMALYGFLCFTALAVSLFSVVVWVGRKGRRDPLHLWFGALCLGYALRVCYPFLRAAGVPLVRPLYALEDFGAFLILYCAARMVCRLGGWEDRRWARYGLFPAALAMCAVGVLCPALLPELPAFSAVYGLLVSWYQLLTALLLLVLALRGAARVGGVTLCGLGVFAVTQAASVLWNGPFEPLRGAWPEEYGGYVLVLCFAGLMAARSRAMAEENRRLTEHLQEEVERQTADLTAMTRERSALLSGMLHDLKSPLALAENYALLVRENGVRLDADQRAKLDLIVDKCRDLGGRMKAIQEWNAQPPVPPRLETLDLSAALRSFYDLNRPDVEVGDVDFLLSLPKRPCPAVADPELLERVLENLVYNAVAFTPAGGKVALSLERQGDWAVITVADTGVGISPGDLPHIFQRGFTTRSASGGQGLGLAIVQENAVRMGGSATASSTPGQGTQFQVRLPVSPDS